ncbi:uncharacterized protein si:dkey-30e9.6 [Xyrichtys novacula]|uniref:Uncharacterized protein si:dkey-30e9.6 n=1 Tax=Xyrichtys novacula TaxID=13765 RepID=A0AAV1FR96_XYRNO|nr:uncharacterized protein si:dkey-30e9.6 [Xyrichtys novacula]
MAPFSLFRPLTSVSFEDKAQFSAHQQLIFKRSQQFKLPEMENRRVDVWSIKPPDFSLKLYKSLTVPQRKDRKKGDTSRAVSQPEVTKRRTTVTLPTVLKEGHHRTKEPLKFITLYRPPDALESELMFVRTGKYPSELYRNPKPHDFRPLDDDLPDIVTTYEKDPGNLKFKLRNLDIIGTTRSESGCTSGDDKSKMDTFKPPEPQWDAKLILPQAPWPPKSASFTRHRRRRGAYSAFLDRVEAKLSKSWKNKS